MAKNLTSANDAGGIVEALLDFDCTRVLDGRIYFRQKESLYWLLLTKETFQGYIRNILTDTAKFKVSSSMLEEVRKRVIHDNRFSAEEGRFYHEDKFHVQNGVIDLDTGVLREESTDDFLYTCHFQYNEKADMSEAPALQKFCETSLGNDPKKLKLLLEIMGYVLSDCITAKSAFFLIGPSNTGKSVLLEFIHKISEEKTISFVPFNKIGARFNRALLAGSRLNICTELSSEKMKDLDFFKAVTSHEMIFAEEKGGEPFRFQARTHLLSAGNVMPKIPEGVGAEAFLRRMVILFFQPVEEEKQDGNLLEKLLRERDTICSLAVKALIELRKRGFRFMLPDDTIRYLSETKVNYDAVKEFIEERCVFGMDHRVHLKTLWEEFQKFCDENSYQPQIGMLQFRQRVVLYPGIISSKFRLHTSNPASGFKGIGLKKDIILGKIPMNNMENPFLGSDVAMGAEKDSHDEMEQWNSGTVEQKEEQ